MRAVGHYFVSNPAALPGVERSANLARENSGQRGVIHPHAHGQPCAPDCREHMPVAS